MKSPAVRPTVMVKIIQLSLVLLLSETAFVSALMWVDRKAIENYVPALANFSDGYFIIYSTASCAEKCSNNNNCTAFFYDQRRICQLSSMIHLTTLINMYRTSQYRYYEISDAECPLDKCYHLLRRPRMCLFLHRGKNNFTSSQALCQSMGGRLPVLDTREKNVMVADLLSLNVKNTTETSGLAIFLGASTAETDPDCRFHWSTGNPVPNFAGPSSEESFWLNGNAAFLERDCLSIKGVFEESPYWMPVDCTTRLPPVVCERLTGASTTGSKRGASVSLLPSFWVVSSFLGLTLALVETVG